MTLNEFIQYLKQQNCAIQPLEKRGLSGRGFYIQVERNGNLRTHHFQTWQFGDEELSDVQIKLVCDQLWLNYPPHLREIPTKKKVQQPPRRKKRK